MLSQEKIVRMSGLVNLSLLKEYRMLLSTIQEVYLDIIQDLANEGFEKIDIKLFIKFMEERGVKNGPLQEQKETQVGE